jgi:hypothetical protein
MTCSLLTQDVAWHSCLTEPAIRSVRSDLIYARGQGPAMAVRQNSDIGSPSKCITIRPRFGAALRWRLTAMRRRFSRMDQHPGQEVRFIGLLVLPVVFLLLSSCNSILPPPIVRKLIICCLFFVFSFPIFLLPICS